MQALKHCLPVLVNTDWSLGRLSTVLVATTVYVPTIIQLKEVDSFGMIRVRVKVGQRPLSMVSFPVVISLMGQTGWAIILLTRVKPPNRVRRNPRSYVTKTSHSHHHPVHRPLPHYQKNAYCHANLSCSTWTRIVARMTSSTFMSEIQNREQAGSSGNWIWYPIHQAVVAASCPQTTISPRQTSTQTQKARALRQRFHSKSP